MDNHSKAVAEFLGIDAADVEEDKQRPDRGFQFPIQEAYEGIERPQELQALQSQAHALQQQGLRVLASE